MATVETTTEGRQATEVLAWGRELVGPALRAAVDTLPHSMRHVAGFHFGWWDEHGRPADATGGKAIRPTLTLLTAEAMGGVAAAGVPAAVAVELVHNFSLLHDDVMDADTTRRHRPTAWSVFGIGTAILAGDALLMLAFQVLTDGGLPAVRPELAMLGAAVQELVDGQSADLAFEDRVEVNLDDSLRMAEAKTGALLGCACALGASFAGGDSEQVEHLRRFGKWLGLAFQHVDDLLGIWGDPAVTGKPVFSDLKSRKKSLPVVAALSFATAASRELAELYRRPEPLSGAELAHVAELVDQAGGRSWSQAQVSELLARALHDLRSARVSQRSVAELAGLASLATSRDH